MIRNFAIKSGLLTLFPAVALTICSGKAQADSCSDFLSGLLAQPPSSQSPEQNTNLSCSILSQQATNSNLFTFDYGVPQSPALMLAGLSTDKVTPANSLKPFVLALPGLLGADSSATSAALDFAPAWALGDTTTNTIHYSDPGVDGWLNRVWYRARVSVALSKGDTGGTDPSQAKPSRAAIGISLSLADGSDPVWARTNDEDKSNTSHWLACLTSKKSDAGPYTPDQVTGWRDLQNGKTDITKIEQGLQQKPDRIVAAAKYVNADASWINSSTNPNDPSTKSKLDALYSQFDAKIKEINASQSAKDANDKASAAIDSCKKESSDIAQHGADLQIGAGVVLQGSPGTLSDLSEPNGAAWIAGRLPFTDIFGGSGLCDPTSGERSELACWTIGGSGRYSAGEMDATGDTTTPMFKANVAEGWVGLERIDSSMKLGAYFGYMDQSAVNVTDKAFSKSGTRWLFTGAYSLSRWVNGLWLVGSYGAANGSTTTLDDKVALLSLTFGPPDLSSTFTQSTTSSSGSQSSSSGQLSSGGP